MELNCVLYMTDTTFQYQINDVLNYASVIGLTDQNDKRKHIKIPKKIGEYPVFEVVDFAFHKNKHIEIVEIPGDLTIIGKNAFSFCPNLELVHFYPATNNSHTVICDEFSFANCLNLRTITCEDYVGFNCANYAFQNCQNLTKMQGRLCLLAKGVFLDCIGLTEIRFADGIKWTGTTFKGCYHLKTVFILGKIDEQVTDFCLNWLKKLCIRCPMDSPIMDWIYDGVCIQII